MNEPTLRWGIIGTGGIASDFCQALTRSARCRVVNVAGPSPDKAHVRQQQGERCDALHLRIMNG